MNLGTGASRLAPCPLQDCRIAVYTDDNGIGAAPRHLQGEGAGSAAKIKDALSRSYPRLLDQRTLECAFARGHRYDYVISGRQPGDPKRRNVSGISCARHPGRRARAER